MLNKKTLEEIEHYKNKIIDAVESIEQILRDNPECESEYHKAHSHYVPQIITALKNDTVWLPRGQYSLQDTIDNLNDKLLESTYRGIVKIY